MWLRNITIFAVVVMIIMSVFAYQKFYQRVDRKLVEEAAYEMFNQMQDADSGTLEGYKFSTIQEARSVYLYLDYEILNSDGVAMEPTRVSGGYTIGWSNAENILKRHYIGEAFVDEIWKKHNEEIMAIPTERWRSIAIYDLITCNYITEYDKETNEKLRNNTIYELSISDETTGICTAYATLMDRLCERAGLESRVVLGTSRYNKAAAEANKTPADMAHCWNELVIRENEDYVVRGHDLTLESNTFTDMDPECADGNTNYLGYIPFTDLELGYRGGTVIYED